MKKIIIVLVFLVVGFVASAQTYIGTMTSGNYTMENVVIKLTKASNGLVTATLYDVKFARMMPVKLDVSIPTLSYVGTELQGDNIVPVSKGKKYEKFLVRKLVGTADAQRMDFSCQMGKKKVTFKGKRMK